MLSVWENPHTPGKSSLVVSGSRFGHGVRRFSASLSKQRWWGQWMEGVPSQRPLGSQASPSLPSGEYVWKQLELHTEKGPHSCSHTAVPCIGPEWVSVSWISLERIICHGTICRHKSEDLWGGFKTANKAFMSSFGCALMLFLSSRTLREQLKTSKRDFSEFRWGK